MIMPHSITPESTPANGSSQTTSQDPIKMDSENKMEPDNTDIAMADASSAAEEEKAKIDLEGIFDDEDSDEEFPSSAPPVKAEEQPSQPAALCVGTPHMRRKC
jgi:DNA primase small subunit